MNILLSIYFIKIQFILNWQLLRILLINAFIYLNFYNL